MKVEAIHELARRAVTIKQAARPIPRHCPTHVAISPQLVQAVREHGPIGYRFIKPIRIPPERPERLGSPPSNGNAESVKLS